jgi:(1->4)-alpha-D-glucan 1-alpha-D-glucosylmutase
LEEETTLNRLDDSGSLERTVERRREPHTPGAAASRPALPATARIPSATYRLQLNSEFTLFHAAEIVEYLNRLGVSDCYLSPIVQARGGSRHGYDVTDHQKFNPEIGGAEGVRAFAYKVRACGMGIIIDTVPNHMCVADSSNKWWFDVLENGPSSRFAGFFDIDWRPPKADLANRILLPVLGEQFGRALEDSRISIGHRNGAFEVTYDDRAFPLAPGTWTPILEPAVARLANELGQSTRQYRKLADIVKALDRLPLRTETNPANVRKRRRETEIIKRRLCALMESNPVVRSAVEASIADLNGIKGEPHSFDRLEALLDEQAYRLSFWHVAADEINYRRFFDVNDLAAIRVEQRKVFKATHELILTLVREGLVSGLRIDHVDGLRDPAQYLRMLQHECAVASAASGTGFASRNGKAMRPAHPAAFQVPFYVVVEKILGRDEPLRVDWPVHGTTGYEFLNDLNGLYIDSANCERLRDFYLRFTSHGREFPDVVYDCKKLVLRALMSGEQNVMARKLDRISEQHRWSRDFTLNSLGRVLAEVIACFPVYRSYVNSDGWISGEDQRRIVTAVKAAKRRNAALSEAPFDFLASVLLQDHPEGLDEGARDERLDFTLRFQQLTSPVMAKGFEDTALYRFYPLASLNEVGGEPTSSGVSVEDFHTRNERRLREWPHGLSATSTHDSKRGEDVRARINVLSEIPDDWERAVHRWHGLNADQRVEWEGARIPDANEEYLFYQTLVGTWPLEKMTPDEHERYVTRIREYMHKSAKEAKFRTSWISPNAAHDEALAHFVCAALRNDPANPFLADFVGFRVQIALAGMLNSLSQTLLKLTSPGVPDFYQGTELWDYSLVDPDNRRPVDFAARRTILEEIAPDADRDRLNLVNELLNRPQDGRIKMYVTHRALQFRRDHRELFATGSYIPLEASGAHARHLIAFTRRAANESAIIAAGRFFIKLESGAHALPAGAAWFDTRLLLAAELAPRRYLDLFTGRAIDVHEKDGATWLSLDEAFALMPISMLVPSD